MKRLPALFAVLLLTSCLGMPDSVQPVQDFEIRRYMGAWYEIARLDHSFERGLDNITAMYSLNEDGTVRVINRGYAVADNEWKQAVGKARFVNDGSQAYLKVSFFGPFYGSYVVFGLDKEHYNYAYVSGPDLSYLWLLSRTSQVPQAVLNDFRNKAQELGFDVDRLIYVKHAR